MNVAGSSEAKPGTDGDAIASDEDGSRIAKPDSGLQGDRFDGVQVWPLHSNPPMTQPLRSAVSGPAIVNEPV